MRIENPEVSVELRDSSATNANTFEPFNSRPAVRRTLIDSPCNKQVKQRYIY